MTSDVRELTMMQELMQARLHLEAALRARDAEAARCTAIRQHLDGAPAPSSALSWQQEDAWCKQYSRWYTSRPWR